jgi:hypothetical protein
MRRGAEAQTDQGPRLSEAQPSSSGTPAGLSTAGCPERSGGTQTPGSPFFSLGFFGETKKCRSPAAATERHRIRQRTQCSIKDKAPIPHPERREKIRDRAFWGSEPKFPEPLARPVGAALRFAAKLRSDPKNQTPSQPPSSIHRKTIKQPTPSSRRQSLHTATPRWMRHIPGFCRGRVGQADAVVMADDG